MNSFSHRKKYSSILLKVVKTRKKLIKMNHSYLNQAKCLSIIDKIENYLSIKPTAKGLSIFVEKNLDLILYLIPGNNCALKFKNEIYEIYEYRKSLRSIS